MARRHHSVIRGLWSRAGVKSSGFVSVSQSLSLADPSLPLPTRVGERGRRSEERRVLYLPTFIFLPNHFAGVAGELG